MKHPTWNGTPYTPTGEVRAKVEYFQSPFTTPSSVNKRKLDSIQAQVGNKITFFESLGKSSSPAGSPSGRSKKQRTKLHPDQFRQINQEEDVETEIVDEPIEEEEQLPVPDEKVQDLLSQLKEREHEMDSTKEYVEHLLKEKQEKEALISALQLDLQEQQEKFQVENQTLQEAVKCYKEINEKTQKKVEDSKERIRQLERTIQNELEDAASKADLHNQQIIQHLQDELSSTQAKLSETQKQLFKEFTESEDLEKNFQKERETMKARMDEILQENVEVDSLLIRLENEGNSMKEVIKKLQVRIASQEEELSSLESTLEKEREEYKVLIDQLQKEKASWIELQEQQRRTIDQLEQHQNVEKDADVFMLVHQLEDQQNHNKQLSQTLHSQQHQLDEYEQFKQFAEDTFWDNTGTIEQLNREVRELQFRIRDLEEELLISQASVEVTTNELHTQYEKNVSFQKQIMQLQLALDDKQLELEQVEKAYRIETKLNQALFRFGEGTIQLPELATAIEQLKERQMQLDNVEGALHSKDKAIKTLKNQLSEKDNQIELLKRLIQRRKEKYNINLKSMQIPAYNTSNNNDKTDSQIAEKPVSTEAKKVSQTPNQTNLAKDAVPSEKIPSVQKSVTKPILVSTSSQQELPPQKPLPIPVPKVTPNPAPTPFSTPVSAGKDRKSIKTVSPATIAGSSSRKSNTRLSTAIRASTIASPAIKPVTTTKVMKEKKESQPKDVRKVFEKVDLNKPASPVTPKK